MKRRILPTNARASETDAASAPSGIRLCGIQSGVASNVGADAEHPACFRIGDDRGVDFRVIGRCDRVPGAVQITLAIFPEFQRDSRSLLAQCLDSRGCGPGDDMYVGTAGDQQRQPALSDAAAADHDDLLALQPKSGQVRVVAHRASLEPAAHATKRATAPGDAAG